MTYESLKLIKSPFDIYIYILADLMHIVLLISQDCVELWNTTQKGNIR